MERMLAYKVDGTILEVVLSKPILPNSKTVFDMKFESQVPIQIRRSGRNNREGIAYSMTQWYPKIAEYDFQGWHAYQYVAREFHSVWGDFDVKITHRSETYHRRNWHAAECATRLVMVMKNLEPM